MELFPWVYEGGDRCYESLIQRCTLITKLHQRIAPSGGILNPNPAKEAYNRLTGHFGVKDIMICKIQHESTWLGYDGHADAKELLCTRLFISTLDTYYLICFQSDIVFRWRIGKLCVSTRAQTKTEVPESSEVSKSEVSRHFLIFSHREPRV